MTFALACCALSMPHPTRSDPSFPAQSYPQFGWSEQVQPLAAALGERLRGRMLDLVSRAYANISPAKLGALLGCSAEEAAAGALLWRA